MKPFSSISFFLATTLALGPAAPAQPPDASQQVAAPLPDIATLLQQADAQQQKNWLAEENYIFDETVTTTDSHGQSKQEQYEIFTINGVRLQRLLARNGKPLPPEDAAKERDRTDKAIAKADERKAKAASRGEETGPDGNALISPARLLQLSTISNVRRETLNGRACIAFDFAGRRDAKSDGISEAIIKSVNGTAWIDEQDRQLARLTGTVPDAFHFGWGLIADISRGSHLTIERAPVRDGVWFPTLIDGGGHARALLFMDVVDGSMHAVYSDYRRFGTSVNIVVPANLQPVTQPQSASPQP